MHFYASSPRFRDIKFELVTFINRSRSRSTTFALTPFDGKCQNVQKTHTYFCTSSIFFRDINFLNVYLKNRSRSPIRRCSTTKIMNDDAEHCADDLYLGHNLISVLLCNGQHVLSDSLMDIRDTT